MDVDRYVAALTPAVPARVADDPRVSIDVLVDLCPELVIYVRPMLQCEAQRLEATDHFGDVGSVLEIAGFSVRVIELEEGVPVPSVCQCVGPADDLHVLLCH